MNKVLVYKIAQTAVELKIFVLAATPSTLPCRSLQTKDEKVGSGISDLY
jgi:hypothetical protein